MKTVNGVNDQGYLKNETDNFEICIRPRLPKNVNEKELTLNH